MDIEVFKKSPAGKIIDTQKGYFAFVPNPLPPKVSYDETIVQLLSEANRNLGNLNGIGTQLPNPALLIIPYVRKEAVLSSRIEGTQTSLSDLFYFEAARKEQQKKEAGRTDILEVYNYVKAIDYGIKRLESLPISLRLIKEIHAILMKGVRGQHLTPGEFRRSQNWIGPAGCTLNDATYVPPPAEEMKEALGDLEKFIHNREALDGLIQCAVMHYQFESIHPFLDGNGRIGRLLTILFLCERQYLKYPLLYLSAYFERNRIQYYEKLLGVSQRGDWPGWIKLFLKAIADESKDAIDNSKVVLSLLDDYRKRVEQKRPSLYVFKLLDLISRNPYISIPRAALLLNTSFPTAKAAVEKLQSMKILTETTDKEWGKIYCAEELLKIFDPK
jgi:Fic family protein